MCSGEVVFMFSDFAYNISHAKYNNWNITLMSFFITWAPKPKNKDALKNNWKIDSIDLSREAPPNFR